MTEWMRNGMRRQGEPWYPLVALGPMDLEVCAKRLLFLQAGVKRRWERAGHGDMIVQPVPPAQLAAVMALIPEIQVGEKGVCWTTHHWLGPVATTQPVPYTSHKGESQP